MAASQDVPNTLELNVYRAEQTFCNRAITHSGKHCFLDLL